MSDRARQRFVTVATLSAMIARQQWDVEAIDLSVDTRAWPRLAADRRRRVTTLLCGFGVAEEAVSMHIGP